MKELSGIPGVFRRRAAPGHIVASIVAFIVSIGIHALIIRTASTLPVNRVNLNDLNRPRQESGFKIIDVKQRFGLQRPDVFSPENPDNNRPVEEVNAALDKFVDEHISKPVEVKSKELVGQEHALEALSELAESTEWEARHDIMSIESKRLADEVIALPRKIIPQIPRTITAPDIVAAFDGITDQMIDSSHVVQPTFEKFDTDVLANTLEKRILTENAALKDETIWQDVSVLIDEADSEITDINPVDHMLRLKLSKYEPLDEQFLYFKISINREGDDVLPPLPKDVLFIQDCSESMTRAKLNECKKGLKLWLDLMAPEDRFNIVGFREEAYKCFKDWSAPKPLPKAQARWFIEKMRARGKTDVFLALQEILNRPVEADRAGITVLLTDGRPTTGMVNSSDIIARFTEDNNGRQSVFTVGGGKRVNGFLLDLISYGNRGDVKLVDKGEKIPDIVQELANELARPVLTDLEYFISGADANAVYPHSLTHLYLDRPLVVYGRCHKEANDIVFRIVGQAGSDKHDMIFALNLNEASKGGNDYRKQWVWHNIYDLIGRHIKTRSPVVLAQLRHLAAKYDLALPYEPEFPIR